MIQYYQKYWTVLQKHGPFENIQKKFGISYCMARLLVNKGLDDEAAIAEYLYPEAHAGNLHRTLPEADRFCEILAKKRAAHAKILVIGDYDVDGVTAVYLMLAGLHLYGIDAEYRIPDRVADGYGMHEEMVKDAYQNGIDTIITVDNGIAAIDAVALAKRYGMTVLVTDHHEPQSQLPEADLIIDPKCTGGPDAMTYLCGAAIAAKLMDRLLEREGYPGFLHQYVEFVAMATICDVMEISRENRVIVREAMKKPVSEWNLGLQALCDAYQITGCVNIFQIGFLLGPSINALGRLEQADPGIQLFQCTSKEAAAKIAEKMVLVNKLRKEQTEQAVDAAKQLIDEEEKWKEHVLVLYLPNCHESIAGIVAGRIREYYYRPAIVLTDTEKDADIIKGSGRSIEGYSLFDALCKAKEYLEKFGGHAMAAGLSLRRDNLKALSSVLNDDFTEKVGKHVKKTTIDLVPPFSVLTTSFAEEIQMMEPFGYGNKKPVFAVKDAVINSIKKIGKQKVFLKLVVSDQMGTKLPVIYFGDSEELLKELELRCGKRELDELYAGRGKNTVISFLYLPECNTYCGETTVQLRMEEYLLD